MDDPTFDYPDLVAFRLLDRLGLSVAALHVRTDRAALACRVVETDDVSKRS